MDRQTKVVSLVDHGDHSSASSTRSDGNIWKAWARISKERAMACKSGYEDIRKKNRNIIRTKDDKVAALYLSLLQGWNSAFFQCYAHNITRPNST